MPPAHLLNGTWDDVNRRLAGAFIALDLHDALVIGDARPTRKGGFFSFRPTPAPRRFVQVTATALSLVGECVGSTSFGGDWKMSEETEAALERQGWERPWSEKYHTYQREAPLVSAPSLAFATVRALQTLGCEVERLEVELIHDELD